MKNIIVVLLVVLYTGCGNIQNSSDSNKVENQIKSESQSTLPQSIYGTYRNNTGEIEVSVSKTTWSSTLHFKNSDGVVYHEVRSNGKVIENELYPIDYIPNISPKLGSFDGKSLRYMYREGDVVICDKVK